MSGTFHMTGVGEFFASGKQEKRISQLEAEVRILKETVSKLERVTMVVSSPVFSRKV